MSIFDHRTRSERRKYREQMLRRYQKQRQRNRLARPGCHDVIVVLDHLKAGYNVAKIFRSAEVFGAAEVQLIGIDAFDPAPAKGAFKQVPARFPESFASAYRDLRERDYQVFYLTADSDREQVQELVTTRFPRRSALVLGHEEHGLSFDPGRFEDLIGIRIRQFGRIESLNVSIAASLAMYEYARQWADRE